MIRLRLRKIGLIKARLIFTLVMCTVLLSMLPEYSDFLNNKTGTLLTWSTYATSVTDPEP
jgi:hypothetical protein